MDNKAFGKVLEKRTKAFAISIIRLSSNLPNTIEAKVIRNQLTKSGSSVGANYREANRTRSKADFYNKIKICESECSETAYWLEIIIDLDWQHNYGINTFLDECNELLGIFTSISRKLKSS
ncbi:MAG: four helix bundle protein [Bacteroidales bacterium]|nr:four helix bundle protein [Bacteroidales bacterium]